MLRVACFTQLSGERLPYPVSSRQRDGTAHSYRIRSAVTWRIDFREGRADRNRFADCQPD
jgi:hypothetical protein